MCDRLLFALGLSCFSDRLWDFGFPILLASSDPTHALFVAALVMLSSQVASFIFSPHLGLLLEGSDKFKALCFAVVGQNGSTVVLSTALIMSEYNWFFYVLTAFFSSAATLSSTCERVILTQEWAPLLMEGKSDVEMAAYNARIRQVYLVTKIVAPLVAGSTFSVLSSTVASLAFICGWNVVSCILELYLLHDIWKALPKLQQKKKNSSPATSDVDDSRSKSSSSAAAASSSSSSIIRVANIFLSHALLPCMMAYSLLFATVLCPGSLLHLHLLSAHGVSETSLAFFQAACSSCGVIGTFLLVQFMSVTGWKIEKSAGLFMFFQVSCLWIACSSLWIFNLPLVFLAFLAMSRVGLWGFDVAHLQIMQLGLVDSPHRALISTVQTGLCDLFSLFVAIPALWWSSQKAVEALMISSLAAVSTSLVLFCVWLSRAEKGKRE